MKRDLKKLLMDTYAEASATEVRIKKWHKEITKITSEMLNDAHAMKVLATRVETLLGEIEDEEAVNNRAIVAEAMAGSPQ